MKILVVDDAENIRHVLSRLLEIAGYKTVEASSGEDAIRVLDTEDVMLALMDIVMPGMGGVEAARRIRARNENLPLIMLSGDEENLCSDNGFPPGIDTLSKPIDAQVLLRTVKRALAKKPHDTE